MQTTWIVAADSSRARIFEVHGEQEHLREIEDFVNPAGRSSDRELRMDVPGRFFGKGERSQGHRAEQEVEPEEHETEQFSKQLCEFLDRAGFEHRYEKLCLIAFPKFLGLMRKNMSKETQRLIEDEVPKDISWEDTREIEDYVRNKLH